MKCFISVMFCCSAHADSSLFVLISCIICKLQCKCWTVNNVLLWTGMIHAGIGETHVNALLTTIGLPSISCKTLKKNGENHRAAHWSGSYPKMRRRSERWVWYCICTGAREDGDSRPDNVWWGYVTSGVPASATMPDLAKTPKHMTAEKTGISRQRPWKQTSQSSCTQTPETAVLSIPRLSAMRIRRRYTISEKM